MSLRFTDRATLDNSRITDAGYLVGEVRCARTGIQHYLGSELGLPTNDVIAVYRPESEVFSRDSLSSYANQPVTDDHPPTGVSADNWKQLAVGDIGGDVVRDGEFVRVPYKLMDSATIAKVQDGKREVSMGYSAEIVFEDGVTPDGEPYQAKQTNIRINHMAIVDKGRAGSACRFGDGQPWGVCPVPTPKGDNQMGLNLTFVGDSSINTDEAGAKTVQALHDAKHEALRQLADAEAKHKQVIADKDAELARKDAEIDALKAAKLSDADIAAMVDSRSALLTTAKALHDADYTGMSDADVRATVVKAKLGDAAVTDKSGDYIRARFDVLAEHKPDAFADAMRDQPTPQPKDNGQSAYIDRLNNAYKGA